MPLNDFYICELRGVKFFEHVFPLKKNVSTAMHKTMPVHDDENVFTSRSGVRESIDESRRSERLELRLVLVILS